MMSLVLYEEVPPPPAPVALVPRGRRQRAVSVAQPGPAEPPPASPPAVAEAMCEVADEARLEAARQHVRWMLDEFKTAPCKVAMPPNTAHDHRACVYYHNERDRRRPLGLTPEGLTYVGCPCPDRFDDLRRCAQGDACGLCHSTAELLYHVDFFRKRLCHQAQRCPRGRLCAFAHSRDELLVPYFGEAVEANPSEEFIAFKFKTEWCPVGGLHDWENCVYAHTYRDWRRHPSLGYSSHPCPDWARSVASSASELGYSKRCRLGLACPMAHGAKEQLYHPGFYKTHPCNDVLCRRGALCAFTHGADDVRSLTFGGAEPSGRAFRGAIPDAEATLRYYQPNFATPPMYHAFEDAPRLHGKGAGKSRMRNRRAKGGGQGAFDDAERAGYYDQQRQRRWGQQGAWPFEAAHVQRPGFQSQEQLQQIGVEQQHQQQRMMLQYALFSSQVSSPWVMNMAPADLGGDVFPVAFGDCMSAGGAGYGSPTHAQQSPFELCLVLPPWLNSPVAESERAGLVSNFYSDGANEGEVETSHAGWGRMSSFGGPDEGYDGAAEVAAEKSGGWRTPSSYGSRTPTAASSPRTAEAASSNTGGGSSEHASWEVGTGSSA